MAPGRPAWKKITARFGPAVVAPDKTISRLRLGALVFSNPEARRFVNALIHPLVIAAQEKAIARIERQGRHRIFVSEAALTVEAGYAPLFDKIVVVYCPPSVQLRRLRERDAISRAEALRKIAAQMPVGEKRRYADYVIDTSGSLAQTIVQTERTYAGLLQNYELKRLEGLERSRRRSARG